MSAPTTATCHAARDCGWAPLLPHQGQVTLEVGHETGETKAASQLKV